VQDDVEGDLLEERVQRLDAADGEARDRPSRHLAHAGHVAAQPLTMERRHHHVAVATVLLAVEKEQRALADVEWKAGDALLVIVR
jgi:hypothetical protein